MQWRRLKLFLPFVRKYRREITIGVVALLLTDAVGLAIPWLLKLFIDLLPEGPERADLLKYAGLLFLAAGAQAVFRYGWRKYMFGPSRKIEYDIINELFRKFLSLDRTFFQQWRIGDLMSRATNDLRAVRDFVGLGLLIMIDTIAVIASSVFLMVFISPWLTMMVLLPLPIVSILCFRFIKKIRERYEIVQEHLANITSRVQENLAGIRVLHAFAQEEYEKRRFDELNRDYIRKNLDVTRLYGMFSPSMVFTLGIAALLSLWLGGKMVVAGGLSLGSFVAFNGYLMMLSWPMMGIGYVLNITQRGLAAMGRIEELLSSQPQVTGPPREAFSGELEGDIEIRNLSFQYPGSDTPVLENVALHVPKGQTAALTGEIGSGKSTLASLIPRLFESPPGAIFIDGRPLRDIPIPVLRENIGYVDQEPFLFSASIRDNILLGDKDAAEGELDRAIRCAGLAPDLDRFPEGVHTIVGERGVSLSGGQKQRIALARALIKKPRILILDDAFSNLDAETEEFILQNIRDYLREATTLIISHRLSTVRDAARIVVMERGRVVEQGAHKELMELNGVYAQTFKNQALAMEMEIMLQ